jgi:hypothetical protein
MARWTPSHRWSPPSGALPRRLARLTLPPAAFGRGGREGGMRTADWSYCCVARYRMVCESLLLFSAAAMTDAGFKSFDCALISTLERYHNPENGNYINYTQFIHYFCVGFIMHIIVMIAIILITL